MTIWLTCTRLDAIGATVKGNVKMEVELTREQAAQAMHDLADKMTTDNYAAWLAERAETSGVPA